MPSLGHCSLNFAHRMMMLRRSQGCGEELPVVEYSCTRMFRCCPRQSLLLDLRLLKEQVLPVEVLTPQDIAVKLPPQAQ